jgi:hypothetical protein
LRAGVSLFHQSIQFIHLIQAILPNNQKLIDSLTPEFKEVVNEIEKSPATCRNHYDKYMSVIGGLSKGSKTTAKIIGLALIQAGANSQGVNDALQFV